MMNRSPFVTLLPRNLVLALTTFGPIGRLKAPGTWGSAIGILAFAVFFVHLDPALYLLLSLLLVFLSVPLCGEAEVRLGIRDPGCVILDEFVAIPLCFLGVAITPGEANWHWILGGFLLFRIFDILKPFGIKRLQDLKGGWGVVADDLAAAVVTNLVLQGIGLFFQNA